MDCRWSHRLVIVSVSTCLLSSGLSLRLMGQDVPKYTVQAYSSLLQVRVIDSQGHPVNGLQREDFVVSENARPVPIIHFEERQREPVSLAVLLDVGSSMSRQQILLAKEFVFSLVHLLDPSDEILLAVYDRDVYFLSSLTKDRYELLEAVENIASGGRVGVWKKLAAGFGSSGMTGGAVDGALLELKQSAYKNKVVLVLSAAFGNLGRATMDHLALAGTRFFAISWKNRVGDALNLWGDRVSRGEILDESGGLSFPGPLAVEWAERISSSLKTFYLLAYEPAGSDEDGDRSKLQVRVPGKAGMQVSFARSVESKNSFY